jgi:uncharacterized membrane protein (DUF485 family)
VAQASSSWQQLIDQILDWMLPEFKTGATKKLALERFRGPGGVLGFLTVVVAMLLWNWKLLLASSAGVGTMMFVYSMQAWRWQLQWSEIKKFLNSPNRRLALAVMSGGIACFSTYMAVVIWLESNSHWLAAAVILQGLATLLTLFLLTWQIVNLYGNRDENQLDNLLNNLIEKDPLKRLIALRLLTKLITNNRIDASELQSIGECLRLLLCHEEEAAIREAAFASLQALERMQILSSNPMAIKIPTKAKVKNRISC